MILSLTPTSLAAYISRQLNYHFPDNEIIKENELEVCTEKALDRLENCFSKVSNHRYHNGYEAVYNHLYSDHNTVFYWFLANTIWQEEKHASLAAKMYYLNKVMHGFDCMYDTGLPDVFLVLHGAGTMLGKAVYNNYFIAMQGCTVGSNGGDYPVLGYGVALTAHSAVIGNCKVGDHCTIGAGTTLFERDLNSGDTIYTDKNTGGLTIRKSGTSYAKPFFKEYL